MVTKSTGCDYTATPRLDFGQSNARVIWSNNNVAASFSNFSMASSSFKYQPAPVAVPFTPYHEMESTDMSNSFQNIVFQEPYKTLSAEELRLEDYERGHRLDKGVQGESSGLKSPVPVQSQTSTKPEVTSRQCVYCRRWYLLADNSGYHCRRHTGMSTLPLRVIPIFLLLDRLLTCQCVDTGQPRNINDAISSGLRVTRDGPLAWSCCRRKVLANGRDYSGCHPCAHRLG